jgi:hypothetical protein
MDLWKIFPVVINGRMHLGSSVLRSPFKSGFFPYTVLGAMAKIEAVHAAKITFALSDMVTLIQAPEANTPA